MAVVAVAVAATTGLTAWWFGTGGEPGPGQPVASVAGAVLSRDAAPPGVAESLRRSVRRVHAEGCGVGRQATSVVVERGGEVTALTNQHVVAGAEEVDVDGIDDPVGVRGLVDGRDAVELDADRLVDGGMAPLDVGPRPPVGARVVVAGYPDGRYRAKAGTVQRIEVRQGFGGSADVLLLDVEAVPGISGGVVVDVAGRAVALVTARDPVTHDVVAYPLDQIGQASDDTTVPCR